MLERRVSCRGLLTGDRAGFAGGSQRPARQFQDLIAGKHGGAGLGQLPVQFLDLGPDRIAQHLVPDRGLFRLDTGHRQLFVLSDQFIAGFALAVAMPLQIGQCDTNLADRLREAELGIVILVERCLDCRQFRC